MTAWCNQILSNRALLSMLCFQIFSTFAMVDPTQPNAPKTEKSRPNQTHGSTRPTDNSGIGVSALLSAARGTTYSLLVYARTCWCTRAPAGVRAHDAAAQSRDEGRETQDRETACLPHAAACTQTDSPGGSTGPATARPRVCCTKCCPSRSPTDYAKANRYDDDASRAVAMGEDAS